MITVTKSTMIRKRFLTFEKRKDVGIKASRLILSNEFADAFRYATERLKALSVPTTENRKETMKPALPSI